MLRTGLSRDLIQSRKVLLTHGLQLIAPDGIRHRHQQSSIYKAESTGIRRDRAATGYRPRQQGGLVAGLGAYVISKDFLECSARVLHC